MFLYCVAGYGLRCHRAVKTICELIGIKDLHCKVEGSTKNIQALTKGFFKALAKQVCTYRMSLIKLVMNQIGHYRNVFFIFILNY